MLQSIVEILRILFFLVIIPLPIGTDHKLKRPAIVTYGLIVANILVFMWLQDFATSSAPGENPFLQLGLVPRHPHVLSFVTSLFVHVSILHIFWNMAFLWLFGRNVEDALGHIAYLILYLGGGVAAGLLHMAIVLLFAENTSVAQSPLVGASGAISAILGLYAIRFYGSKIELYWVGAALLDRTWARLQAPALWGLALWLAIEIWGAVFSFFHPDRAGIAYWAHIGGFIFGMLAAVLTDMLGEGAREYLLTEAKDAQARGDDQGLAAAVRRYWVVWQRSPYDQEAHEGLTQLVKETAQGGPEGAQALAAECTSLLDVSISLDDRAHALAWYEEMRNCGFDPPLPPRTLSFLAASYLEKEDFESSSRLYQRLLQRFPDAPEAEWSRLELATLLLGQQGASAEATSLLQEFLAKYPESPHRPLAENLLESALARHNAK